MWWADIEVPNTAVDMSSWAVSACYPRRTFYPLSDGPSTRTTGSPWPTSLLDLSVSQSGKLMPLHLRTISTVLSLPRTPPLLFGRRPPQSNYPPYNVLMPDNGYQLDIKKQKRYFTGDPQKLTFCFNVPPMLNMFFLTQCKVAVKVHGSFRLTTRTPHLHGEFNFTELMLETAEKSLRHSCRSELTRQGISLP